MNVVIRVDAAPELGSGHAVRTLTLADSLALAGHRVTFAVVRMPDDLRDRILAGAHTLVSLPDDGWSAPLAGEWSTELQQRDSANFLAAAAAADWVVCDHYGLGRDWETAVRSASTKVMAIDDLGRAHACDLLLDQNYYAEPATRYPAGPTATLIGPQYALLRPTFAAARAATAPRRGVVGRLLLFMGGIDAADATSLALDAIEAAGLADLPLDVVIGAEQPSRQAIAARCEARAAWRLHVQTSDMAGLLAAADLAIGAGGSATWERCALGVPTLALEVADNQREVLREGARAGFLYTIEGRPNRDSLALHLQALVANSGLREHLSAMAWALTDGEGTRRVVAAMSTAEEVAIRPAEPRDCRDLHNWRNAQPVRAVSRDTGEIAYLDHAAWFARTLDNPDRWLLIGERKGAPVGVVRFDRKGGDSAEVSIYLAPPATGGGGALLLAAERWLAANVTDIEYVTAVVIAGNERSERLFERCGYARASRSYSKRIA